MCNQELWASMNFSSIGVFVSAKKLEVLRGAMYGCGAEMSMQCLYYGCWKNNFSNRNRTTMLDIDNGELLKQ